MAISTTPVTVITLICDSSAEEHLAANLKQLNPLNIQIEKSDNSGNRIKAEILVGIGSGRQKVVDYLNQYYLKPYNGIIYITEVGLVS